ncbi:flagellin [Rubrivivax gelatinosus]|nr:flagellin [Rubrivivax gelatinosus]
MSRLGTGYRVSSAMDDAAGLQIAVRLDAQSRGMTVAMRNTQNAISLFQTADGALSEVTGILLRMKDLATEAYNETSSSSDKAAMQGEFDALGRELRNVIVNTSFGGQRLFDPTPSGGSPSGLLAKGSVTFQIGSTAAEQVSFDASSAIQALTGDGTGLGWMAYSFRSTSLDTDYGLEFTLLPNGFIQTISQAIDDVSSLRSQFGAFSNRLDHTFGNLSNMVSNTTAAKGRILDTDYAAEAVSMATSQMKAQAAGTMLKSSKSLVDLATLLVR